MSRFFLIVSIAIVSCTPTHRNANAIAFDSDLDNYFSNLSANGFSGAVLIEKNDTILLKKGFGFSDKENKKKTTPQTAFHIASLGKQFTAAAILKLYSEKKLNLNDPIQKYIAGFRSGTPGSCTIHQLLTHTSGITEYYRPAGAILSKEAYLEEVIKVQENSESQPQYSYSNTGYEVLAILIEEISGLPYEDYLLKNFFQPLNMNDTGFTGDHKWEKQYISRGTGGAKNNYANEGDVTYGNKGSGSVITTIDDLYKWEKAIRNYTILSKTVTALWFKEHTTAEVNTLFYGYGWRANTSERNTKIIWHSGWEDAFNSVYYRFIDEGVTLIFLSNYAVGLDPVRNVLFPALNTTETESIIFDLEKAIKPLADLPETWRSFSGKFYLDDNNYIELTHTTNNKTIQLKPFGQQLIGLLYEYSGDEKEMLDSIYNRTAQLSNALANETINIKAYVNALGAFDPYNFYNQDNVWVEKMLLKDSLNYGKPHAIRVAGTAHSYASRIHHNATAIKFVYPDTIISFDYVNYGDEKYFVRNGSNVFNLFLSVSGTDNMWLLQDMMERFSDKGIRIDKKRSRLSIINIANSDNEKKSDLTLYRRE